MDQETLNAVFRRAVRQGNFEDVKKYIVQGADVRDIHYDLALEGGHKDIVEYLHTCGFPDLRSAKLLSLIAHGHNTLAAEAIKAGAVPTAEHLAVATKELRPLLEKAMGLTETPQQEEFRIRFDIVFPRTGDMHVEMSSTLVKVPTYVREGSYKTEIIFDLRDKGPDDLPQPVLGAIGPAAPPEPRVLRLRSRKITYA